MISINNNRVVAGTAMSTPAARRMSFFDNLKVLMMVMVIVHHVGQAYGPIGAWWPVQELTRLEMLKAFFMVNRSFGMSLFFMIAGFFTASSCEKSGPAGLARNRILRLGIPLLGFSLFTILLQVFVFGLFETGELGAAWPVDVIHFWFVQHLLLYSLGYAVWRWLRRGSPQRAVRTMDPPGYGSVLTFAIVLTIATAIVRTWYDIDEWVYLFGYLRIAPADVPRDLGLFLVGTLAYRNAWVNRFSSKAGQVWLAVGIALAGLWYGYELCLTNILVFSAAVWGLLLPLWESLLCCGMCIGLTVVFRDRVNSQTPLLWKMAQSSYAVYMLHIFVVILFQSLALRLALPIPLKFVLVSLVTVPVSFLLGSLIRRPLRL